mmetsp:Transcript_12476/g.30627  ORF Transcript_12476/g.30627 Transcript_12476/m.30627 type:complete len:367 (-) Transcript_12476:77-1177(-)
MEQLGQAGLKMTALQRECSTLKEELSTANSATQRAEEKLSAATDRVQELETALGDLRRLHDRVTSQDGILEPREQVVRLRDALDQQQEALRTSCDEALELKGHLTKLVRAFSSTAATVLSSAVLIELFREFEAETEEIGTSLNAGEAAGRLRDLSRVCAQIVNRGTSLGSLVPLCEELIFRLQDTCVTLGGELGELAHQHQSTREVAGDTISGLMDSLQSVSSEAKALMLSTRRMAKVVAVQALLQPHLGKARGDDFAERSAMSTPRGRQDHGRSGRSASPAPKKLLGVHTALVSPSPQSAFSDVDLSEMKHQFQALDSALGHAVSQSRTAKNRLLQLEVMESSRSWGHALPRRRGERAIATPLSQ